MHVYYYGMRLNCLMHCATVIRLLPKVPRGLQLRPHSSLCSIACSTLVLDLIVKYRWPKELVRALKVPTYT